MGAVRQQQRLQCRTSPNGVRECGKMHKPPANVRLPDQTALFKRRVVVNTELGCSC